MTEVFCMGRVGIDLYPNDTRTPLDEVSSFRRFLGGSAGNVAVALARLGHDCALISARGDDPFGRFVQRALTEFGVDATWVLTRPIPTPVTFCEVHPPDHFPLYFYRRPLAPDLTVTAGELPMDQIATAPVFWATATGLSASPSRDTQHAVWSARRRSPLTVLDLDYRPALWSSADEARRAIGEALTQVSVAIGNREECEIAVGETEPERAAAALLERGIDLVIVKRGLRGVLAVTADERVDLPAFDIPIVNGLGAGDAFGGALVHGLLAGWSLGRTLEFASAAGAMVAGRLECAGAMPDAAAVGAFIRSSRRPSSPG